MEDRDPGPADGPPSQEPQPSGVTLRAEVLTALLQLATPGADPAWLADPVREKRRAKADYARAYRRRKKEEESAGTDEAAKRAAKARYARDYRRKKKLEVEDMLRTLDDDQLDGVAAKKAAKARYARAYRRKKKLQAEASHRTQPEREKEEEEERV